MKRVSELTAHQRAAVTTQALLQRPSVSAEWVRRNCEYPALSSAYGLLNNLSLVLPIFNAHGRWICYSEQREEADSLAHLLRRRLGELPPGAPGVLLSGAETNRLLRVLETLTIRPPA